MADTPEVRGLEGVDVWGGGGPTWLCSGRGVREGSGELSPPLLQPDAPGAWELRVSLGGGEGGPAGSQGLSYFCNPEHTCHSRREGQTLGAGLECRGQAAEGGSVGSCGCTPPGSSAGPCIAPWGRCVTQSKVRGVGRDGGRDAGAVLWRGFGESTKSKYPLQWGGEEFNSRVWGLYFMLSAWKNQVRQSPV